MVPSWWARTLKYSLSVAVALVKAREATRMCASTTQGVPALETHPSASGYCTQLQGREIKREHEREQVH